jgi:metal-responsive CopG/Arc/MetJ family transcriptional regulator
MTSTRPTSIQVYLPATMVDEIDGYLPLTVPPMSRSHFVRNAIRAYIQALVMEE